MKINTIKVGSLGEYIDAIAEIAREYAMDNWKTNPPVLWFRGQNKGTYSLLPSLYRNGLQPEQTSGEKEYTQLHYAEDIRIQHYMAKNFHLLRSQPSAKIEWLEVMQHHGIKTRLLDWSESAIHSLLFALECFFDGKAYSAEFRRQSMPCVWVLNPGRLNKMIFEEIRDEVTVKDNTSDIAAGCTGVRDTSLRGQIIKQYGSMETDVTEWFTKYGRFEEYMETKGTQHIDYIVNLSKLNEAVLREGEGINPYYYAIYKIYSDGILVNERKLPPLAIVNAYHSERIRAQRGVFTVFPYYQDHQSDQEVRKMGINPDAMDHNEIAQKCLSRITLYSPQKIAYELMAAGINTSWLYPEMPIIANEIENRRVL